MVTSDFVHCAICHYSCNTCNGPLETNCQSCFADHIISGGKCVTDTSKKKKKKQQLIEWLNDCIKKSLELQIKKFLAVIIFVVAKKFY